MFKHELFVWAGTDSEEQRNAMVRAYNIESDIFCEALDNRYAAESTVARMGHHPCKSRWYVKMPERDVVLDDVARA